jgi:hypothetical protein
VRQVAEILKLWYENEGATEQDIKEMALTEFFYDIIDLIQYSAETKGLDTVMDFIQYSSYTKGLDTILSL